MTHTPTLQYFPLLIIWFHSFSMYNSPYLSIIHLLILHIVMFFCFFVVIFTWRLLWLYYIVLYCIVLYCIVLYCIVLYCIVLYCIVLYYIELYCVALYCIVLYCIILYYIVLYCAIFCCHLLYSCRVIKTAAATLKFENMNINRNIQWDDAFYFFIAESLIFLTSQFVIVFFPLAFTYKILLQTHACTDI